MKTLLLFLALSITTYAQDTPSSTTWKGVTLDQTTAAEAITKFGKPKSDKITDVNVPAFGPTLTKELKQKKWRMLQFKDFEGIGAIIAVFGSADKLVYLQFKPNDLEASTFAGAYPLQFRPVFSSYDQIFSPKDFSRDGNGNMYAKSYPVSYYLIGKAETSFVMGLISNPVGIKKILGGQDSGMFYPGRAVGVALISRTLENKSGLDDLKFAKDTRKISRTRP